MQRKLVNAENWPEIAVNLFKEAISHAVSIRFRPEYKDFKSNQYFGDLEIRKSSGKRVNIAENLVKQGIAAMSGDFLHGTLSNYVTQKYRRCHKYANCFSIFSKYCRYQTNYDHQ